VCGLGSDDDVKARSRSDCPEPGRAHGIAAGWRTLGEGRSKWSGLGLEEWIRDRMLPGLAVDGGPTVGPGWDAMVMMPVGSLRDAVMLPWRAQVASAE